MTAPVSLLDKLKALAAESKAMPKAKPGRPKSKPSISLPSSKPTAVNSKPVEPFTSEDNEKRIVLDRSWTDLALVLYVHRVKCSCCSEVFITPNQSIMIERSHPRLGTHYLSVDKAKTLELSYNAALPRRVEFRTSSVPSCHICFNTGESHVSTRWSQEISGSDDSLVRPNPGRSTQESNPAPNRSENGEGKVWSDFTTHRAASRQLAAGADSSLPENSGPSSV